MKILCLCGAYGSADVSFPNFDLLLVSLPMDILTSQQKFAVQLGWLSKPEVCERY